MRAISDAIPNDGYRLFAVDPGTLLINRLLAASDTDGWARVEWLRDVYLRADELGYIELPVLMQSGLTAVAFHETQETCWGYRPDMLARLDPANHRRLFHEQRSPAGGSLLACFPADGKWVAALQTYRRDPKAPFKSSDVSFVQAMAPAIGKAIAAALSREQAKSIVSPEDEPAGISDRGGGWRSGVRDPCRRGVVPADRRAGNGRPRSDPDRRLGRDRTVAWRRRTVRRAGGAGRDWLGADRGLAGRCRTVQSRSCWRRSARRPFPRRLRIGR